ncbi:MAG: selenocysteine-specific translation elongation factor, partial [Desulfomonilaceae bacterium]
MKTSKKEVLTDNGKLRAMDKFITVGVAGHVDHGKTSLVRCLTGIDTDRLKEEKRRGLSIEPSVAPLQLSSGSRIALVDVPGHSDFLKNTIRGLSSVDTAILLVAADDGVMPQTKDHLEVLKFLKAKGGFIVLSKADVVDLETLELAEMEIREIVEGSFLEAKPVIPFSAMDGRGLHDILLAMESEAERVAGKVLQDPFRLWIDQARSFLGFGTVISGTVLSGSIKRDDIVELLPSGMQAKVRFIEVHHQRVEQAIAGQRVGINLHGISLQEVSLGAVLAASGVLSPARLLNAELSLLPKARRPILNRQRVKVYVGTYCTTALLVIMENERLHPGETGLVQLRLQEPLAVLPRDPFVISPMNLHCVIGGGTILEAPKEKFRAARSEKTLAYLQPLQRDDVKSAIRLYMVKFSSRPVTSEEISSATGFPVESVRAAMKSRMKAGKLLYLDGRGYFDRGPYEVLKRQLVDITRNILLQDAFKAAASSDEIRFRLDPTLDDAPFERLLGELCKEGKLVKTDAGYRIPNFVVKLPSHRERLVEKLVEFAKKQGYETFSAGTFWKIHGEGFEHREVEKVLDHLHAQKKLVRLNDGRFLTIEAMQEIKEKVTELILQKGSLTLQDSKVILGYGRT